jgi:hypothetical protein
MIIPILNWMCCILVFLQGNISNCLLFVSFPRLNTIYHGAHFSGEVSKQPVHFGEEQLF